MGTWRTAAAATLLALWGGCGGGAPAARDGGRPPGDGGDGSLDAPLGDAPRDAPPLFPGDAADGPAGDGAEAADLDGDGLPDADEARLVRDYLPYLSLDPDDGCPRAGVLYRARPHPDAPALVHVTVILLLENDCGAGGHAGDDEAFGMTLDPAQPPPAGLLALRAISHQDTLCETVTECGRCGGLAACTTATRAGAEMPVVFYSKDKHGAYLHESSCDGACFLTNWCSLNPTPLDPPLVNAGEPDHPLVNDLTAAGFITAANGWTAADLLHFDPWADVDFGGAGNVRGDLLDDRFVTPTCQ